MTAHSRQKAVLYCRISDKGQTGLGSQEHRCRQYAEAKDYEVAAIFYDKFTGGVDFMKREGMVDLLKYLDDNPQHNYVVIFDDLKRYARNTFFHLGLRIEMEKRGATRECLNFNFEDTPEGRFNETINAAVSELDRETIARQSRQKIIARLEAGYAVYSRPPIGYKYVKSRNGNGKVLVRDEPFASIVAEAMESFASGRFSSQAEIGRYLESHPSFPKHKVRVQRITNMLTQPLYAGYVGSKELGVSLREGRHEGLVSKATFEKIQDRINGQANAPARKDLHRNFPLRGAVACSGCGKNLRGSSSKGKYKYYAYYACHTKGCEHYAKSIPRAKIEGEFAALIKGVQPSRNVVKTVIGMCRVYWNMQVRQASENAKAIKADIRKTEAQIGKLVDRIVEVTNESAIGALENKIGELEKRKLVLAEKAHNSALPQPTFEESIEHSLRFVANPYNIWEKGVFELKRLVLRMVFPEPVIYDRESGYRTPETSIIFSMLGGKSSDFLPVLDDGGRRKS
jgi:DNA invertase Pin-like site-specific DNA recombinase